MKQAICNDYDFSKKILDSIFDNPEPVNSTLERFAEKKENNKVQVSERLHGLLHRCGNIHAVKEFLTYLVFETYALTNNDYSYQLSRLGFFETLQESDIFTAMKKEEQKKLLKLMKWQFERVKRLNDYICRNIKDPAKLNVLDLGCGIGQLSYLMAEKGMNVTAVDLTVKEAVKIQEVLKNRINYTSKITFIERNALDLSNIKGKFDIATLADVVEHITEKEKLFFEVEKKLNNNGYIVLHTDNLTKLNLLLSVKRLIYLMTFRNPKKYNLAWSGGEGGHVGLDTPGGIMNYLKKLDYSPQMQYDKDTFSAKVFPKLFANGFMVIAQKQH